MSLFEHFFKVLSLYLEAGRRTSKWKVGSGSASKWLVGSGSGFASTWCGSATLLKSINKSSLLHEYCMLLFFAGGGGRVCSKGNKNGGTTGLLAGNHGRKMVLTNWFPEGKWCERHVPGCQLISIMVYRWFSLSHKFIPLILDKSQLRKGTISKDFYLLSLFS